MRRIEDEAVNKAIEYILNNIDRNIHPQDVAGFCHFSEYYFERRFRKATGESIYGFIKRSRIEQSAFRLKAERERSVTDVGFEYGYTPSNYSSLFRKHFDESPVAFRRKLGKKDQYRHFMTGSEFSLMSYEECRKHITIEDYDDIKVIYQRYLSNYSDMKQDWSDFNDKYSEYICEDTQFFERTFDDPSITDEDRCLYDICISAFDGCRLDNQCLLTGGKFAVYHFSGQIEDIYPVHQSIVNVWLPQSGLMIDSRSGYDRYLIADCEKGYFVIDFCMPVK